MAKNKLLTAALALLIGCGTTTAEQLRVSSLYNNPNSHWNRGDAVSRLEINTENSSSPLIPEQATGEKVLITNLNVPREIRELVNRVAPYARENDERIYGVDIFVRNPQLSYIVSVRVNPSGLNTHSLAVYAFDHQEFQIGRVDFPLDGRINLILSPDGQLTEPASFDDTIEYRQDIEEINEILRMYLPE